MRVMTDPCGVRLPLLLLLLGWVMVGCWVGLELAGWLVGWGLGWGALLLPLGVVGALGGVSVGWGAVP